VSATNSGTWTDATSWEFTVRPPFYRRGWFAAAASLALLVLVGAAWQLRLRAVRRQHALVLAERAHVSREIHDTLLQNLAAIGMELETIVHELGESQRSGRESLRRLQRQVGHSLREARDLVVTLRHNATLTSNGLVESLRELAVEGSAARRAEVTIEVAGQPRRCSPDVELQLLRIAQEAVNNARRHGRATAIRVIVEFGSDALSLRVTDDGSGFVPSGGSDEIEHLGLLGMEERADRIGARLTITSTPLGGTTVATIVPWGRS
jgi:signal transduction histidine kinase